MKEDMAHKIALMYGLRVATVQPIQKGYRNESHALTLVGGDMRNLIIYKAEPGILEKIKNANMVSNFLAHSDLPARQTADNRIMKLATVGRMDRYAALYTYLPGNTIPWEAYTMEHLKQLGGAMSDMHTQLSKFQIDTLPSVTDQCLHLCQEMQLYFDQTGVRRALAQKLKLHILFVAQPYEKIFHSFAPENGQQALHMDFVRGNVLFADNSAVQLTGVLDFEKTARGLPLFDIARTLAFLFVDCKHKSSRQVYRYFLHSGYNKRGSSRLTEFGNLGPLTDFYLLHDLYKFLHHNPYEYLPQNEHFRRTCGFLLQRNLIRPFA